MFVFFLFCINMGWWIFTKNNVVTSHDVCKPSVWSTASTYAVQYDNYISVRLEQQHKKTHILGKQIFFPYHMRWERYLTYKYVITRNVSQSQTDELSKKKCVTGNLQKYKVVKRKKAWETVTDQRRPRRHDD